MTLQQTLQADSKKTIELFKRLEDTSDQAVKTRENVLVELARELRLHADIDERDLFPILRRDPKSKDLVTEAAKRNRELRTKLDELEALPKGDASFRERVTELRKLFQQQIREERQELVPAVPEDRREAVEEKIETRRAKVEEERQAEDEERRQVARRDAEHRNAAAARSRAAEELTEAGRRTARDVAETVSERAQEGAEAIRETSQKAAEGAVAAARRVREAAGETVTSYRDTVRESRDDARAITGSFGTFLRVSSELNSILLNSAWQSVRNQIGSAGELVRNPLKFGQVQREYAATASRITIETAKEVLQVLRSASTAAREPLDRRLRASA